MSSVAILKKLYSVFYSFATIFSLDHAAPSLCFWMHVHHLTFPRVVLSSVFCGCLAVETGLAEDWLSRSTWHVHCEQVQMSVWPPFCWGRLRVANGLAGRRLFEVGNRKDFSLVEKRIVSISITNAARLTLRRKKERSGNWPPSEYLAGETRRWIRKTTFVKEFTDEGEDVASVCADTRRPDVEDASSSYAHHYRVKNLQAKVFVEACTGTTRNSEREGGSKSVQNYSLPIQAEQHWVNGEDIQPANMFLPWDFQR